jgi:hypothetical protein
MKHATSAHCSDRLMLSLWDLVKLAIGCKLQVSGLLIQAYRMPKA